MQKIKIKNFSLEYTLECGQLFRYSKKDGFYFLVAGNKIIKLMQKGDELCFEGATLDFIKNYFRLDGDYEKIINDLKKDRHLAQAIKKYKGLRLCRQDSWECLVSYICSAASNIPKIQKNVENLAKSFGKKITLNGFKSYSFPAPEEIKSLCTIKSCGCGFRSRYIFETAGRISEKKLNELRKLGYEEAKKALVKLPGVGEKVADCVLLFSLGFDEAFPIDVWIKRTMERLYFNSKKTSIKKLRDFAMKRFGKNCGYAQQFLFYSGRNG